MSSDTHYYDISFVNSGTTPAKAQFFDNRSIPLVKVPEDYHLSVVRFLIPTAYLPIFVWPSSGNNLPNNTYFSVTIENIIAGTQSQQFLTYVPANNLTSSDENYLFLYSYQQFIDAVNVALAASFTAVGGAATSPPYMTFDSAQGLFSVVALQVYADQAQYKIYFNNALFGLFENFEAIRLRGATLGRDNQILIKNNGDNRYSGYAPGYPLGVADDSFIMTQEYVSTFLFNKIRSLLFVSNSVPVANESLNVKNSLTTTTSSEYRKILTDFTMNIESGLSNNTVRSYVQYVPSGEYRLIDLVGTQPLYTFDLQIFFQTADLQIFPLLIPVGESLSIKIMFRGKKFRGGLGF